MKLNRDFFEGFLIRHRRILVALLVATVVWLLASNVAGSTSVVLVTTPIPAGSNISADALSLLEVRGALPEGFISDITKVQNLYTNQTLTPGSFLLSSHLSPTPSDANRLIASLPLEAGDNSLYPPGSLVRVWAMKDEGAVFITNDAIVMSTEQSVGANNRVTLAFDEASEYQLMQAFALRLVIYQA